MRFIYFLFLLVFLGAVGAFTYYNREDVNLRFLDRDLKMPLAALVGGAYVLGMLSGWSVVGMLRRSIKAVTEHRGQPRA